MPLADRLAAEQIVNRRTRCSVTILLDELDNTDRATLLAAFGDTRIGNAMIARALAAEGHTHIRANTIGRHRQGACSCGSR